MAEKKETVVTTTITTTKTTTTVKEKCGWKSFSTIKKVLLILLVAILTAIALVIIFFGRAHIKGHGMEDAYQENSTVCFSRYSSPDVNDVILYRHPEADSIVPSSPDKNYYKSCRLYGQSWCNKSEVVFQGKKRRPICASRVAGMPGEVICINEGVPCKVAGGKAVPLAQDANVKEVYVIGSNSYFTPSVLDSLGITKAGMSCDELDNDQILGFYRHRAPQGCYLAVYALSASQVESLKSLSMVSFLEKVVLPQEHFDQTVFPYVEARHFNFSYMTPMVVPAKGKVLKLDINNLPIYRRCIEVYEGNSIEVSGNTISINGKESASYRFKRDYYFVINDNRASTDDSRYFGFLPSNYVVGVVK